MSLEAFDVKDRTVIISGAARGIGRGIAHVLAESGARVLVTALTDRYLAPLAQAQMAVGHSIEGLVADATKAEDWQRTVEHALGIWGHIDVLINNLGDAISKPIVPLPGTPSDGPLSDQEWTRVIDINLTEAFLGCRAVGPHFIEQRRGKVINISSWAARRGTPGMLAYATAKGALVRFTQTLALEWAPYGITVNAIAPGTFPDPETWSQEQVAETVERAKTTVPLGRPGALEEVGYLAQYLIADAGNYMTGETIHLDGGASSS